MQIPEMQKKKKKKKKKKKLRKLGLILRQLHLNWLR